MLGEPVDEGHVREQFVDCYGSADLEDVDKLGVRVNLGLALAVLDQRLQLADDLGLAQLRQIHRLLHAKV